MLSGSGLLTVNLLDVERQQVIVAARRPLMRSRCVAAAAAAAAAAVAAGVYTAVLLAAAINRLQALYRSSSGEQRTNSIQCSAS